MKMRTGLLPIVITERINKQKVGDNLAIWLMIYPFGCRK